MQMQSIAPSNEFDLEMMKKIAVFERVSPITNQ